MKENDEKLYEKLEKNKKELIDLYIKYTEEKFMYCPVCYKEVSDYCVVNNNCSYGCDCESGCKKEDAKNMNSLDMKDLISITKNELTEDEKEKVIESFYRRQKSMISVMNEEMTKKAKRLYEIFILYKTKNNLLKTKNFIITYGKGRGYYHNNNDIYEINIIFRKNMFKKYNINLIFIDDEIFINDVVYNNNEIYISDIQVYTEIYDMVEEEVVDTIDKKLKLEIQLRELAKTGRIYRFLYRFGKKLDSQLHEIQVIERLKLLNNIDKIKLKKHNTNSFNNNTNSFNNNVIIGDNNKIKNNK